MTSKERHEARYRRRKAKREKRKAELNTLYGDFDKTISLKSLWKSYYACRGNVKWKGSVQNYGLDLMKNTYLSHEKLKNGEDTFKGFYTFDVNERGKIRHIRSVHISERCIQKSFCKNALVPMLSNTFIYDNGASLKGKGTAFAIDRLTLHLHQWYRIHGNAGYVIKGDFKQYFDNIDHETVLSIVDKAFSDKRFVEYVKRGISHYGEKGLGLGSEENQIFAVAVPNRLDQFLKTEKGIRQYARYNDDFYILVETKEEARKLLKEIRRVTDKLKITLNEKKTQIIKLSHGFTFLKTKFNLTDSGKVLRRPDRSKMLRERRKLKSLRRMLDEGLVTVKYVCMQYKSWRGQFEPDKKKHKPRLYECKYRKWYAHKSLVSMDRLFHELFIKKFVKGGTQYVYSH